MIYYGIDIRPLEQLYPDLWLEFVQLDEFFNTKPFGMIGLPVDEEWDYGELELFEQFSDIIQELSKMMSISLGIAVDQLPRKYYDVEEN